MNKNLPVFQTRFLRVVMALLVAFGALAVAPVAAASTAESGSTVVEQQGKKKAKVKTKAKKQNKVKKGEEFTIEGSMEDLTGERSAALFGSVILQSQTSAGLWVNLGSPSPCRPNGTFTLSLRVQTSLTLRVFAPETDVYVAASSSVFAVIAI
ncbi:MULTISPECIES: hypothetical protein [unclassified Crossiella]|uniref:hypothetical protein n=1 Tax=unclassified Crossiella TaxID=2620835 RepID=UPI0020000621|nr:MULTISPECIES: hypothetical protein [unclassified Crossiella]MCK2236618.1 hypothetical protein [Crossiella sp. S99.2]MCK2250286.1 hypothetical protein [Crossiella sp. S99.1]